MYRYRWPQHEAINSPIFAKFRPHAGEGQEFKHGLNNWPWAFWWKGLESWGHPTKYWFLNERVKSYTISIDFYFPSCWYQKEMIERLRCLYTTYHSWSSKPQSLLSNLSKQHCQKGASICQSLHQNQVVGDSTFPKHSEFIHVGNLQLALSLATTSLRIHFLHAQGQSNDHEIKHVPTQWAKHFGEATDRWNKQLREFSIDFPVPCEKHDSLAISCHTTMILVASDVDCSCNSFNLKFQSNRGTCGSPTDSQTKPE